MVRLGAVSPIALGVFYTVCVLAVTAIGNLVPVSILGTAVVIISSMVVFGVLFVTVTWFRDDDWLAAGVLMTLVVYAATALQGLSVILFKGGIGPAALYGAVTAGGAIIYAIIMAPIAGGLVALARRLTRNSHYELNRS
jgi:hypothetical protein